MARLARALLLTLNRHWLCTAAMVLIPVSPLSKYSFEALGCRLLSLGEDMQRREFITLLGGAAAWPLTARAQRAGSVRRIALLTLTSSQEETHMFAAFIDGLQRLGYVEGEGRGCT